MPFGIGKPNISKLKASSDVNGLINALAYRGDPEVRCNAVLALRSIGGDQAIDAISIALQDPLAEVRAYAANTIGEVGNRRSVDALIRALGEKEDSALGEIVRSLGKLGDSRAAKPLAKLLKERDSGQYELIRPEVVAALCRLHDPLGSKELAFFKHAQPLIKYRLLELLYNVEDVNVLEALIDVEWDFEQHWASMKETQEWLGKYNTFGGEQMKNQSKQEREHFEYAKMRLETLKKTSH